MVWQFTVDKYLNPYYPPSIIPRLPPWIARWLGYHQTKPKPDYLLWLDIMIGTFAGLLTLEGIFKHSGIFKEHHAPILIASYGATAILLFNANQVPLAQPRNIFVGQFVSSLIAVILLKLFSLSEIGTNHLYIGAALSTAIASVVMSILGCVHPPSGATALIPLIDSDIGQMGWWYIPVQLVSSTVIIGVGLITNNVVRRYPVYWWTSYSKPKIIDDEEKTESNIKSNEIGAMNSVESILIKNDNIIISRNELIIPDSISLELSEVEHLALNTIKLKLQEIDELSRQVTKNTADN